MTYSVNQEPEAERLGRLQHTFPFDTRRVATNAAWGVAIGAVFTLISIVVVEHELSSNISTHGPNYFVGLLIVLALLLPLSLARLVQAVMRRDEQYLIYECGFVRHTVASDDSVYWTDVAQVRTFGNTGGWRHAVALDFRCRITCADGRKFGLSTLIDDAEVFARTVSRRAAEAQGAAPGD